jgi:hypothetical protein
MSIFGAASMFFVLIWLLLTVPYQYVPWSQHIARYDLIGLLPRWTFFAPNPAISDLHLLVRDRLENGQYTDWQELQLSHDRIWYESLWNPAKRARKAFNDAAQLLKTITRRDGMWAPGSLPYLILLNCCVHGLPKQDNAKERQFSIVESVGRNERKLWIIYTSQFHPF